MVDKEKSSKSEAWKETFVPVYWEALKKIDVLSKKWNFASSIMTELDNSKDTKEFNEDTKAIVRYELAVRFAMDKHKALDVLYSQISSVLDKKDAKGNPLMCPSCNGQGIVNDISCKVCGGCGKVIDHEFSLAFKTMSSVVNLQRDIRALGGAGANPNDAVLAAYQQLESMGLKGDDAREALKMIAIQLKLGPKDAEDFTNGYFEYLKAKEEAENAKSQTEKKS